MDVFLPDLDSDAGDGQVVNRYQPLAYSYARRRGLRHEDAEDICQEVLLRSHQSSLLAGLQADAPGGARVVQTLARWVIASFRRHELAAVRDRRRDQPMAGRDPVDPRGNRDDDGEHRGRLLAEAMHDLRHEPVIQALRLKLSGHSYSRIAGILRKRVHDVTNYLHRAKSRLRIHLRHLLEGEGSEGSRRPIPAAVRCTPARPAKKVGKAGPRPLWGLTAQALGHATARIDDALPRRA